MFFDYQEWCNEVDSKYEQENKIFKQKREEENKIYKQLIEEYKRQKGNYWYYSDANVYVPISKKSVPSLDKVNSTHYDFYIGKVLHSQKGSNRKPIYNR